jgi:uncharacterized protein (TIGR02266 family)
MLEAGVTVDAQNHKRRAPRAAISLEVAFHSREDAAKAYTRDVGTGGLALLTEIPLQEGTKVSLRLKVPGWSDPLAVEGEVLSARDKAVGIAFKDLPEDSEKKLKELVAGSGSFLGRIKTAVAAKKAQGEPVAAAIGGRDTILVRLADRSLADGVEEILALDGYLAVESIAPGVTAGLVVCDMDFLPVAMSKHQGIPVVLVNVSGPDALAGKLAGFRASAFVKRPANASSVCQAVRRVIPKVSSR